MKAYNLMIKSLPLILVLGVLIFDTTSCKKKEGCTDPQALNYDAEAKVDNGSCLYPTESRKVTFIEFTATWCLQCGSWGSDAFHQTLADNPDELIGIASHSSPTDPMYNSVAQAFIDNFSIDNWPNYWIGNDFLANNYFQVNNYLPTYMAQPVVANVLALYSIDATGITVRTSTKFFKDATGDFYLGVYVLESGIDGSPTAGAYAQSGTNDPNYTHDHVLRAAATANPWGDQIVSGSATAGEIINMTYTIPLQVEWNTENLDIVCVIWKANGSSYDYVNAAEGTEETVN